MLCRDCGAYDPIDSTKGKCKRNHVERHVVSSEGHTGDIINGWPIVEGDEQACTEIE
jgi:hypothetical protein